MPEESSGLMGSARQLLVTLISIVSTRLDLLANELQEERLRLSQMFLFALIALFCFSVGTLLLTVFIVLLFQDEYRIAAIGVLSVVFLAAGALTWLLFRSKARTSSRLFSASLAELSRDRAELERGQDRPDQP